MKVRRFPRHCQVGVGLAMLGLLTYWQGATSPALFGDEWGRVSQIAFDGMQCPSDANIFLRPLLGCYPLGLHALLGKAFWAYHMVSLVWVILNSFLVYVILDQLFPSCNGLAIATGALSLVYPADFCRLFFERGSFEVSLLLFLCACLCWIRWRESRHIERYVSSVGLLLASLVLYEAHLGLVILGSVLLVLYDMGASATRRLANIVPSLIAMVWLVGRAVAQVRHDGVFGHRTEDLVTTPARTATRMYLGLRTVFQWAWTSQIAQVVPYQKHPLLLTIPLLLITALAFWIGKLLCRGRLIGQDNDRRLLTLIGLGVVIAIAGYMPMILAVRPSLSFLGSRVNRLPAIGASVTVAAVLYYASQRLANQAGTRNLTYIALCAPLVILGMAAHVQAQDCTSRAWEQQKRLWQEMIQIAPGLARDTSVLLLATQDTNACTGGASTVEGGPWGLSGALSVLYGRDDVRGWFAHIDLESPEDTTQGLLEWNIGQARRLVFLYDEATDRLGLLESGGLLPGSTCQDCILPSPPADVGWRWLVQ